MNRFKKTGLAAVLVGSTIVGGAFGSSLTGSANAASDTSTSVTQSAPAQAPSGSFDPSKGGHTANGITETLLTGDDAIKAKDAVMAAYPGATIQRVETDADGAKYEAHIVTSDGTPTTVTLDDNFKVTGTEDGPGGGHGPAASSSNSSAGA